MRKLLAPLQLGRIFDPVKDVCGNAYVRVSFGMNRFVVSFVGGTLLPLWLEKGLFSPTPRYENL
jgi:hypothetical protein